MAGELQETSKKVSRPIAFGRGAAADLRCACFLVVTSLCLPAVLIPRLRCLCRRCCVWSHRKMRWLRRPKRARSARISERMLSLPLVLASVASSPSCLVLAVVSLIVLRCACVLVRRRKHDVANCRHSHALTRCWFFLFPFSEFLCCAAGSRGCRGEDHVIHESPLHCAVLASPGTTPRFPQLLTACRPRLRNRRRTCVSAHAGLASSLATCCMFRLALLDAGSCSCAITTSSDKSRSVGNASFRASIDHGFQFHEFAGQE